MRRRILAFVLALSLPVFTAAAQRLGPAPKRSRATLVSDSNDAHALFDYAVSVFETDPDRSAEAFYWSARLDPSSAQALYGYRSALLMRQPRMLALSIEGGRRAFESKDLRRLDSLQLRALMLNPFLYRWLDKQMFVSYFRNDIEARMRRTGEQANRNELDYLINNYLASAGPDMRAWMAYCNGNFGSSLQLYAVSMKGQKFKAGTRVERARIFGMQGAPDSAIAEFRLAVTEMRQRDTKDLVVFYNSKALLEHSVAVLLEQKDDIDGAREAYGSALQEDLSFYPAHLRLGLMAVTAKDTTTALSELDLATQLAANEPLVRVMYGVALHQFGRDADARVQLEKAIELEPYYALPYFTLGQVQEKQGAAPQAIASYSAFLARASHNAPQRQEAEQRLAALKGS